MLWSYTHTCCYLEYASVSHSVIGWHQSGWKLSAPQTIDDLTCLRLNKNKQTNKNIVFNPAKSEPWNKNWQKMILKVEYLLNILKNPCLCINMIEGHERVKTFTTIKWCLLYLLLWSEPWASQLRRKLLPTFNIKQIFVWALCSESWRLRPSEQKGNLLLIFYHS